MTPEELAYLPLAEQARLIARGDLSPVELTRTYLERIDRWNPVLNDWITVTADRALDAARDAEREIA